MMESLNHQAKKSRRDFQLAHGSEGHVSPAVIDDRVFARLRKDSVEMTPRPGAMGISRDSGERMFRIATRVNGDEHAADELGSGL
jgi:hypothetical protein